MVNWSADHISFVIVAYAIVVLVLGTVVAATLLRASALKKTLRDLNMPDSGQNGSS